MFFILILLALCKRKLNRNEKDILCKYVHIDAVNRIDRIFLPLERRIEQINLIGDLPRRVLFEKQQIKKNFLRKIANLMEEIKKIAVSCSFNKKKGKKRDKQSVFKEKTRSKNNSRSIQKNIPKFVNSLKNDLRSRVNLFIKELKVSKDEIYPQIRQLEDCFRKSIKNFAGKEPLVRCINREKREKQLKNENVEVLEERNQNCCSLEE